ncbi:MAG: hypothetical protein MRZ79_07710 [Bacteroidia bacterium]|nr:hypothetical protein [Bacteroidia bacterium]
MKHLTILLFILASLSIMGHAQGNDTYVKGVTFKVEDSLILVNYSLEGKGLFHVRAYYASDENGPYEEIPVGTTKGDLGKRVRKGQDKSFKWELLKARPGFVGLMTIKVTAEPFVDQGTAPPYNIMLSALSYAPLPDGPPSDFDLNTFGARFGWGDKWGGRLSYLQSSTYDETFFTLSIAKSIARSQSANWNIYVTGGPLFVRSAPEPSISEWLIGGGTDFVFGPLCLNFDVLSTTDGQLRAVGGIGWAFKAR